MDKSKNNSSLISVVSTELEGLSKSGTFEFICVEYKYQGLEQFGGFQVRTNLCDES